MSTPLPSPEQCLATIRAKYDYTEEELRQQREELKRSSLVDMEHLLDDIQECAKRKAWTTIQAHLFHLLDFLRCYPEELSNPKYAQQFMKYGILKEEVKEDTKKDE